jgi:hypothetical protein
MGDSEHPIGMGNGKRYSIPVDARISNRLKLTGNEGLNAAKPRTVY